MLLFSQLKRIGLLLSFLLVLYLVNPFDYGHFFGYLIVITLLLQKKVLVPLLDKTFVFILLFSTTYALFYASNPISGIQFVLIYLLLPPFFFILGKKIGHSVEKNKLPLLLCFFVFLFSLSPLLSVLKNIMEGGFVQIERSIPMIWNGNPVSATIMGSFLTLNMCIPSILITRPVNFNTISKLLLTLLFILSLMCTLRLGSRTQLGIIVITSLISFAYIFPKQGIKKNTQMIFTLAISIILFFKYSSINLNSDILTAFAGRMKDSNNNIANAGGRSDRWVKSLKHMFSDPLGWDVNVFGHSHNLWFDVLRVGGIIAFILLIIFTIRATRNMVKKVRNKNVSLSSKVHLLVYFIGFILIFMVEPILEGMSSLFIFFCLFIGIVAENKSFTGKSN